MPGLNSKFPEKGRGRLSLRTGGNSYPKSGQPCVTEGEKRRVVHTMANRQVGPCVHGSCLYRRGCGEVSGKALAELERNVIL